MTCGYADPLCDGPFQDLYLAKEAGLLASLIDRARLSDADRRNIHQRALDFAARARRGSRRGQLVDRFLQEYGLSTEEGVTLMRLCEALIRTPDALTAASLVRDKIGSGGWADHAEHSQSPLVNLSTRGLQLSAAWISSTGGSRARHLAAKLGDAVLLQAMQQAMALMGEHFVLGATIKAAVKKARHSEKAGFTFSYDMLGEAAHTADDAERYFDAYYQAMAALSENAHQYSSISEAPGLSVKLSALNPRYEFAQRDACTPALVSRFKELALIAKSAGLGLTIDAEEADRLETSLQIVAALLRDPALEHWDGLGFVVQAYQRRAPAVIDVLATMAREASRSITVRLVKGAYWDMEIKRAQELGLASYPVFTRKENTDISYLACTRQLFDAGDHIFPQFATHNAHTAAAVMEMAGGRRTYEFQRLHGMGEALHEALMAESGVRSRVYAPVGRHKDLLPYLVRRLLENGANSSFVNQLLDAAYAIEDIVRDPIAIAQGNDVAENPAIPAPTDIFGGERQSAAGLDLTQSRTASKIEGLASKHEHLHAASIVNGASRAGERASVISPTTGQPIGSIVGADKDIVDEAIRIATTSSWVRQSPPEARAAVLNRAADLLEIEQHRFLRLCVIEAGKTWPDAVAEVREAIDFCRYYAAQCTALSMGGRAPFGVIACISPWNFPLAIFLGQVVASLAAGNAVIAKPAEQTPLIAHEAVRLLFRAGVPEDALHLIIGDGPALGAHLVASADVDGVCFTGSTRTAKHIAASLADTGRPQAPLIAETGGINAMLIDSTALMEQAVTDVIASAFQSAGQRCSACRIVCVQDDIADDFFSMLTGAIALLRVGDPALLSTDVGPVIDSAAHVNLTRYIEEKRTTWRVLAESARPDDCPKGHFIAPIAFEVPSISSLTDEIFGPVLHVMRFPASAFDDVISEINGLGYGLTMGLHTRIDDRVDYVASRAHVGNLYVNRNQIGAVVGVQPFGGESLSGTGPKAGGPHYLRRLSRPANAGRESHALDSSSLDLITRTEADANILARARCGFEALQRVDRPAIFLNAGGAIRIHDTERATLLQRLGALGRKTFAQSVMLPGPTGERNTLSLHGRGVLLCLGGNEPADLEKQIAMSLIAGASVIALASPEEEAKATPLLLALYDEGLPEDAVAFASRDGEASWLLADIDGCVREGGLRPKVAAALLRRPGAILPLLSWRDDPERFCVERTLTVNTTAAGGNASLLAM